MSTKISVGDTVEVLQRGTAARHMVGVRGRVVKVNSDGWVYVEDPTGQGVFAAYGDTTSWMFMPEHVKKVEEDLAEWEKELLGISEPRKLQVGDRVRVVRATNAWTAQFVGKQGMVTYVHDTGGLDVEIEGDLTLIHRPEGLDYIPEVPKEETMQEQQVIEAGDTVRVIDEVGGHGLEVGTTHTVKAVEVPEDGNYAMIVLDVPGTRTASYAKRFELVSKAEAPKPKAKSQEIKLEDVQVGDTVVAFWNLCGVEYRQKGTVAEINDTGEPLTAEGNFVVHTGGASRAYSFGSPAEHIYLISRPEKVEPKPEDALDKAKTYVAYGKKLGYAPWYLRHIGGEWRFSSTKDVNESSAPVRGVEDELLEATSVWEKPVEYVEPPKTIQEQLDELGVKAGDTYTLTSWKGAVYQFLGGGKLRYSDTAQPNPWWTNRNVDESDLEQIVDGSFTKIS